LEDAAKRVTMWNLSLLPGLLQTPEYRRQVAWAEDPAWTPDDVSRRIELTTRRQAQLKDPKRELAVMLSEAILRQQIGGRTVMADQLNHLADIATLPNVSIRVVPFEVWDAIGPVAGSFVMLEFPPLPSTKLQEPPVVYVEGYTGDLYLERDGEIAKYRDAIARIQRIALNDEATRDLVLAIAREFS
jgi:hypothetical protein